MGYMLTAGVEGPVLVLPLLAWMFIMPFGSINPLERWTPRFDPEGKVYMWIRPFSDDVVWTQITKIGTMRWNLKDKS